MEILDTSIANVALPYMAGNLGVSNDESTWVLTSYLVSNAIILAGQRLDRRRGGPQAPVHGVHRLLHLSSLLCGIAPSLAFLLFFRVLQGLGGGGLQPLAQAILADTFPPEQRGLAFALYGITAVVAPDRRTGSRRVDYLQLLVALDLLHQSARRPPGALSRSSSHRGPAVSEGRQASGRTR